MIQHLVCRALPLGALLPLLLAVASCFGFNEPATLVLAADGQSVFVPDKLIDQKPSSTYQIFDGKYPKRWPVWLKLPEGAFVDPDTKFKETKNREYIASSREENEIWKNSYELSLLIHQPLADVNREVTKQYDSVRLKYETQNLNDTGQGAPMWKYEMYEPSNMMLIQLLTIEVPGNDEWTYVMVAITYAK